MKNLVVVSKSLSIYLGDDAKKIELCTCERDFNRNFISAAEARQIADALIHMADKLDPKGREKYLVDAYTLDVYKREADEAATEASRIHLFADSEREYQEAYQAKLAEIGQWILGYSKEVGK